MSICVYGRINKRCIDTDLLEKMIAEYFSSSTNIFKQSCKENITYEGIDDDNIIISFVSEKKPPYNVYDSSIIDGEFEYNQLLIFDIKKEESSMDKYQEIVNFCIYVRGKIESDILVTSDAHDEICLLKEQEVIHP